MTAQAVNKNGAAHAAPKRPARKMPGKQLLGIAGILAFLLVWELVPRVGIVEPRFLPPASEVIGALARDFGLTAFWVAVGETMLAWLLGLVIAIVLATVLGFIIGSSSFLRKLTNSTVEFLRPIPSVALIPLAVLLFGTQIESKLLLVVYAAFWQMLIQVLYGVQDVDPVAQDTARAYRFGFAARVRYVTWPTALPYVMTGLRLSASVALILAVTAELVIGNPGLGNRIAVAQSSGAIAATYALVVVTGLVGVAVNLVFRFVERRALSWHPSQRGEVAL
jgi:ABC-type nitrate/sulfonate/bicarbonate transport system permease component